MLYHEYAIQPFERRGVMVPRSSLPDFFSRPDAGYCSVYAFDQAAVFSIRAQGDSTNLSRFSVYSDRLWIDVDGSDSSPQEVERIKVYTRELTKQFIAEDFDFTVWSSGSKGFHVCIKIAPMQGKDVPYSQLLYVRDTLNVVSDFSLYQHARLLSNPGRVHPKTGKKKEKVFEHKGKTVPEIPIISAPKKSEIDPDSLTSKDLLRIGYSRLVSLVLDAPIAGGRHTAYWSVASQLLESGMDLQTVCGNLLFCNRLMPDPKSDEDVLRACNQAAHQLGLK